MLGKIIRDHPAISVSNDTTHTYHKHIACEFPKRRFKKFRNRTNLPMKLPAVILNYQPAKMALKAVDSAVVTQFQPPGNNRPASAENTTWRVVLEDGMIA